MVMKLLSARRETQPLIFVLIITRIKEHQMASYHGNSATASIDVSECDLYCLLPYSQQFRVSIDQACWLL